MQQHPVFEKKTTVFFLPPRKALCFWVDHPFIISIIVNALSQTPWGNFFKFGINIYLESSMSWLALVGSYDNIPYQCMIGLNGEVVTFYIQKVIFFANYSMLINQEQSRRLWPHLVTYWIGDSNVGRPPWNCDDCRDPLCCRVDFKNSKPFIFSKSSFLAFLCMWKHTRKLTVFYVTKPLH